MKSERKLLNALGIIRNPGASVHKPFEFSVFLTVSRAVRARPLGSELFSLCTEFPIGFQSRVNKSV